MIKINFIKVLIILLSLYSLSSCSKCDDLRPLTSMLIGTWKLDTNLIWSINNKDIRPNVKYHFMENNTYTTVDSNSIFIKNINIITSPGADGQWEETEEPKK